MTTLKEKIKYKTEINDEDYVIVGGDFNARVGKKGGRVSNTGDNGKRKSKDKNENKKGKQLLKLVEERGWEILNGNRIGDNEDD